MEAKAKAASDAAAAIKADQERLNLQRAEQAAEERTRLEAEVRISVVLRRGGMVWRGCGLLAVSCCGARFISE